MILPSLAIAPVIIILFYLYIKDKYEKEPKSFILKLLFFGALTVIPAGILEAIIGFETESSSIIPLFLYTLLGVGLIEEGVKFFVLKPASWRSPHFNQYFDGILYSVAVSLGFALIENIFYVCSSGIGVGILRAFTAVPLHTVCAIYMGYFLSKSKFDQQSNPTSCLIAAVLIPSAIHGIYDFLCMSSESQNPLFTILLLPFSLFALLFSFSLVEKAIASDSIPYEANMIKEASFAYAGFFRRFWAFLIDFILVVFEIFIILGSVANYLNEKFLYDDRSQFLGTLSVLLLSVIFCWLYYTISESSSRKGTLGKIFLGIKVVSEADNQRISFAQANARYWSKILSFLPLLLGFFSVITNPKKQGFHDRIANVLVVRQKITLTEKPVEETVVSTDLNTDV